MSADLPAYAESIAGKKWDVGEPRGLEGKACWTPSDFNSVYATVLLIFESISNPAGCATLDQRNRAQLQVLREGRLMADHYCDIYPTRRDSSTCSEIGKKERG